MTKRIDLTGLPNEKLVEIIVDLLDRMEAVEKKLFSDKYKVPDGHVALKAVSAFGFHPETVRCWNAEN
jgi:hypothetical protein